MLREIIKTYRLSDFDGVRLNNFTAIRLLLAMTVLVGHSFPITGNGSDPITMLILPHAWIGSIAVGGFFAVSGFLVSASIQNRSLKDFAISRALRLYPAAIVYSLVAVLLIGPLASSVSISQYFSAKPWNYLWNATLWEFMYNLPHAFADRTFPGSTNGSLWTLPAELRCYIAVFILGFIGLFNTREIANTALISALVLIKMNFTEVPLFGGNARFEEPLMFFITGSLFWVNRDFIPMNWLICAALVVATFWYAGTGWYWYFYMPAVAYCILMATYRLPHFDMDKFGDISYGVYIYAWPVQQLMWSQGQNAYVNAALATMVVVPVAYASWRFVEKPALSLRGFLGQRRKGINFEQPSKI